MSRRQLAFLVGKAAFATAVLIWLFRKVDVGQVLRTVQGAGRLHIGLGVALFLSMVLIGAWRWREWLSIFGIYIPYIALACVAQIGQFFMMFVPGPTGDVLGRMYYISRLAPGRVGEACTTVVLDRCIGLATVLGLAVFCLPFQWSVLSTSPQTHWLALAILTAGSAICLFGILFFAAGHPTQTWITRRLDSFPAHSVRDEASRIWGLLCANKSALLKIIAAALLTQFIYCGVLFLAGLSVGIYVPFVVWLSFVPILLAADALPITIAGLGVREYLLVLLLGVSANIPPEKALAASVVAFAIILISCLLGGPVYVFYKPRAPSTE